MKRSLFYCIGWISLFLGVIGAFLPLLPTTPFMILAAWCFARSSARLHYWILNQPGIGELVRAWEQDKVIALPAKILASITILISVSLSLYFIPLALSLRLIVVCSVFCVVTFIWSYPSCVK